MKVWTIVFIGLLLTWSLVACGYSPLFNHSTAVLAVAGDGDPGAARSPADVACPLSFSQTRLCAQLNWVKQPSGDETGDFELRFWSLDGGTATGPFVDPALTVSVKLWMPSMGHGSSPVKVSRLLDQHGQPRAGEFTATGVYFVMPGAWEIHVQLKEGSRVVEEVILPIDI